MSNATSNCDNCEKELNLSELENWLCIDCRPVQEKIENKNISTCDICYNEREKDMMVKCCDKNKFRVCECNVSICRRCADHMNKTCPTCRKIFDMFIYEDEVLDKPIVTKSKVVTTRHINQTTFSVGEDVLIHDIVGIDTVLYVRKARIMKINQSSVSIQLYSYTVVNSPIDRYFNIRRIYTWTERLENKKICIKNLRRLTKREDDVNNVNFEYVRTSYNCMR
jgi:hypothetical protein